MTLKVGSREHYGWDDWYAVSVRHVFRGPGGLPTHAWLTGPRGPHGEPLSLLVAARTPPGGWQEPTAGRRLDVWAWPVDPATAAQWEQGLAAGHEPELADPGRPQQWLQVVASGPVPAEHPLARARTFRGVTFRGRPDAAHDLPADRVVESRGGVATSADLRVATRNFARTSVWCVLGDEGRVAGERPGLAPLAEVFFLPGTRFRRLSAWVDDVDGHELDVVLVHQLDSVRGEETPPFVSPAALPAHVGRLARQALAEPPLRLREEGRFVGGLD